MLYPYPSHIPLKIDCSVIAKFFVISVEIFSVAVPFIFIVLSGFTVNSTPLIICVLAVFSNKLILSPTALISDGCSWLGKFPTTKLVISDIAILLSSFFPKIILI